MVYRKVDFSTIANKISGKLFEGHERSVRAKKNILQTIFLKGISIAISFIVVPLTLNYVDASRYGLMLTLTSMIAWFSFFDIGLTQGLRNKFAEARAKGDDDIAQVYVSTAYAILGVIFFIVWVIFMILNYYLDLSKIMNVSGELRGDLSTLSIIIFTYFCINFVLRIVPTLFIADQQPAKSDLLDVSGQILSFIIILILVYTTKGSLIYLGLAFCGAPLIVMLFANLFFFRKKFYRFRPRFSKINLVYVKDLFNLGFVFFIIQLAGIIQYQTANIIIARNFGSVEVTAYNIVYKYFGILLMVFTIFLTPFWSAATDAYHKQDKQWIINGIKKYNQLNLLVIILGILMLSFSGLFYRLWLGEGNIRIDFQLSLWGFLYFNVAIFGSKYVHFLNGINALRIQFISSLISPFIYITVILILIKTYHWGAFSIFIASIIANYNALILAPLQYYQVIVRNKRGIWTK